MRFFCMAFFFLFFCFPVFSFEACLKELYLTQKNKVQPKWAKRFFYYKGDDGIVLVTPEMSILLQKKENKSICKGILKIKIPLTKTVALSTSYIPWFELLKKEKSLLAFPGKNLNFPPSPEKILEFNPEAVLGFVAQKTDEDLRKKLTVFSIPWIEFSEYKEHHPLGRAQWLIFFSLFFDEEKNANEIFSSIEKKFTEGIKLSSKVKEKKSVLMGSFQGDFFVAPSPSSDIGELIALAGGDYLLNKEISKVTLEMKEEKIYQILHNEKKKITWLPLNEWHTQREILLNDRRYKNLPHFKEIKIFHNMAQKTPEGLNDYWQTASARPDLLLFDLISILHPELSNHKTFWFAEMSK